MSKDIYGRDLPQPWVTQEVHDAVVRDTKLRQGQELPANHAYLHWLASAWTLYYWNLTVVDQTRKLAEKDAEIERLRQRIDELENPPPRELDPNDGGGGFLWKPVSDNTGKPVILFPASDTGRLDRGSCEIVEPTTLSKLYSCPFRTVANGDREHYNVPVLAAELPQSIAVLIAEKSGLRTIREISNPTQRYD